MKIQISQQCMAVKMSPKTKIAIKDSPNVTRVHDMGWLRLVGSLETKVSFAKEPYKRDYILQKTVKMSQGYTIWGGYD